MAFVSSMYDPSSVNWVQCEGDEYGSEDSLAMVSSEMGISGSGTSGNGFEGIVGGSSEGRTWLVMSGGEDGGLSMVARQNVSLGFIGS